MEIKKNDNVNLEKRKGIFLQLGLVIVLALCLIAFEWSTGSRKTTAFDQVSEEVIEEEMIPITEMEQPEPEAPPEVPKVTEIFEIVDDDVAIENEILFEDDEADIDEEIQMYDFDVTEEEEEEEEEIFVVVEDMPTFRGGDVNKFREWVQSRIKYPQIAAENGIQGKVFIMFVVEPDGSVSNVTILRSVDPALDNEAKRVVESSPKWAPGKQRGAPVRVRFSITVNFQLQ
ncbi:MAG: energy transducer TonB [Bacteroidales bacterium]|jgi:protein TonB|nr:energy transducer TonB [Bacteroidales bacterium]